MLKVGFHQGTEDYFPDLHLAPEELIQMFQEVFDEEHTSYHLGQIVDRTKRMTKKSFNFCQNGINERSLRALILEQNSNKL